MRSFLTALAAFPPIHHGKVVSSTISVKEYAVPVQQDGVHFGGPSNQRHSTASKADHGKSKLVMGRVFSPVCQCRLQKLSSSVNLG